MKQVIFSVKFKDNIGPFLGYLSKCENLLYCHVTDLDIENLLLNGRKKDYSSVYEGTNFFFYSTEIDEIMSK
ncbi:hypothetical protein A1OK_07070 [Enterovibrio norvegicus FF-454]|uniref:Uncharacterized protein n=1 Tax=Enterovibrio norvegicus FF-454 TaxID=1185651 RepID=A0A1E5CD54_9GAMM|nr:hypothetical protein A1OK_07070 [Enterovibrio norvegicus FF-454]